MKKLVTLSLQITLSIVVLFSVSCDNYKIPYAKPLDDLKARELALNVSCSNNENKAGTEEKPIVIMVSIDGFRADYLQRFNPPTLQKIAKAGIYSSGLIPSYPSHTYPNHFTLATGRYPANHGIISNRFYDTKRKEIYDAFVGDSSADGSWYSGDPIWNVVEKNGMISHTFHWVGSEVHVNGEDPTCYAAYSSKVTTGQRVDMAIDWLKLPAKIRPHFINIYTPDVDSAGHKSGPNSEEVKKTVLAVDRELARLWDFVRSSDLPINIVIVSDHGMQENYQDKIIYLTKYTSISDFQMSDKGAAVQLYNDNPARVAKVYQDLKAHEGNFKVYLKHEIPAEYRMTNSDRTGDILIVSKPGHYVTDRTFNPDKPGTVGGGSHGWPTENKSMHALFIAAGHNIVKRRTPIGEFKNVDVYPFVMELLDIQSAMPHDGNAATLRPYILPN
jgi:predicted AlkP superfamily pyrophosphatase or phosphodiesterase